MTEFETGYWLGFRQGEETGYARAEEDMAAAWRQIPARWNALGRTPTVAELAERRRPGGVAYEARMRRHGREYEGGPVEFWTGRPMRESA